MHRFLSFVILFIGSMIAVAQDNSHSGAGNTDKLSRLLKDQLRFSSEGHDELLPDLENPSQTVHRETGRILLDDGAQAKAIWVYRGTKGKPQGDLDLIAVEAGKAKTFLSARKACEKLIPLGEWHLVNVVHVMAFFSDLLPSHPMFEKPQFKGTFFWANSLNEEQNSKNRDDFVASNDGGGEPMQILSYRRFIQWIHASIKKAQASDEKTYYQELLKKVDEGIPVLCFRGKEPKK